MVTAPCGVLREVEEGIEGALERRIREQGGEAVGGAREQSPASSRPLPLRFTQFVLAPYTCSSHPEHITAHSSSPSRLNPHNFLFTLSQLLLHLRLLLLRRDRHRSLNKRGRRNSR